MNASYVALITGAGSGIGAATAQRLSRGGTRLVLVDREPEPLRALAQRFGAIPVVGDVTDPEVNTHAVRTAVNTYGQLDLLHANAGRMSTGDLTAVDLESLDLATFRDTVDVNVEAVVLAIRSALPMLRRGRATSVIVTASLAGLTPFSPDPVYTMTKHALVGLVRSLAEPLAAHGVTISAVCPGFVDTPLIADARDRFTVAGFPLITPEDAAAAVEHAWCTARPGALWVLQPGRDPLAYRPAGVPGPRTGEARLPPTRRSGDAPNHDENE